MVGLQPLERGTTCSFSTNVRWLGPNDKIVVDGFDDPRCRVSPAASAVRKREA